MPSQNSHVTMTCCSSICTPSTSVGPERRNAASSPTRTMTSKPSKPTSVGTIESLTTNSIGGGPTSNCSSGWNQFPRQSAMPFPHEGAPTPRGLQIQGRAGKPDVHCCYDSRLWVATQPRHHDLRSSAHFSCQYAVCRTQLGDAALPRDPAIVETNCHQRVDPARPFRAPRVRSDRPTSRRERHRSGRTLRTLRVFRRCPKPAPSGFPASAPHRCCSRCQVRISVRWRDCERKHQTRGLLATENAAPATTSSWTITSGRWICCHQPPTSSSSATTSTGARTTSTLIDQRTMSSGAQPWLTCTSLAVARIM